MKNSQEERPKCPHCGSEMLKWEPPAQNTWGDPYHYVCFNDDCPYYINGWDHMWRTQQSRSSYRCQFNPRNRLCSPIPVWSPYDLKDGIIE